MQKATIALFGLGAGLLIAMFSTGSEFQSANAQTPGALSYAEERALIENLQARYLFALDFKDHDLHVTTFTPDGILDVGNGPIAGRDAIKNAVANMPGGRHHISNLVLKIDGDRATGRASWFHTGKDSEGRMTIGEQERKYRTFFRETAQALVPGFRLPDESQYGPAWAVVEGRGWRTRDGSGLTKAEFWTSGEFNGDGITDYAYILVEQATDTRNLVAFVSMGEGYEVERLDAGFEWGNWLRTLQPGRYQPAVGRNIAPDATSSDSAFVAQYQAIEFFRFDGEAASFVWNPATGMFDRYQTVY